MSVDDIIKDLNLMGWIVNNLFQFRHDHWRCNLQRKTTTGSTVNVFTEFADGKTMLEAVRAAHLNAKEKRNFVAPTGKKRLQAAKEVDTLTNSQELRLDAALTRLLEAARM